MVRLLVFLAAAATLGAQPAQLQCQVTGDPFRVRSEGLTELLGSIVMSCTGPANGQISSSFSIFLSLPVTNRLNQANGTIDAELTAATSAGTQVLGGPPLLVGRGNVIFNAFSLTLPADGRVTFRIAGIRVAPGSALNETPITAVISTSGTTGLSLSSSLVTIGVASRSLFTNGSTARIFCQTSNLPEEITFGGLIQAATRSATIRITESHPTFFERRQFLATQNGVRFLIRYSGLPASARVFVPELIAGSTAQIPTSAGDLGLPVHAGLYSASSGGSLLLALVRNADFAGAGDAPLVNGQAILGGILLGSMSEVRLVGGEGVAVYEVVDASNQVSETAQIPTFIHLPPGSRDEGAVASARISYAPLSSLAQADSAAPILRFADVAPQLDCPLLRDCTAGYFPRLVTDVPPLEFSVAANTPGFYQRFLRVLNEGGGAMVWSAAITYRRGNGWLRLFPASGVNNTSANLTALPEGLAPGTYEAVLTIDAGVLAGTRQFPITLTVTEPAAPVPPPVTPPEIRGVFNSANPALTTVTPGSLASIRGVRMLEPSFNVAFNGLVAAVVNAGPVGPEQQINVVVPEGLGTAPSAQLVVTAGNVPSPARTVTVGIAPSIFAGGVLNQNGSRNSRESPEHTGRVLQVFATGLPATALGTITARIHDRDITTPAFAGSTPGTAGVQQVNFLIPEDLPTMLTELMVCGAALNDPARHVCSRPAEVWIQSALEP